ncbi:MAG: ligand-binding sensor domain-containing diguanylate cyclase [Gemmatimonadaceae bacterium]
MNCLHLATVAVALPTVSHRLRRMVAGVASGGAILLVAAPAAATLGAQSDRPTIAVWTTEHGLPSNIVLGIQQTRDGYLWLASYQGLVRFDGVDFRTLTETDIPGLARSSFRAVARDSAGALWAATESAGVVRLSGGEWRVFTTRDGLPSDRLTAMTVDHRGDVWVGSRAGVSRIADGRVESLPPLPTTEGEGGASVTALAASIDGTLWIGTVTGGVLRYRDGTYSRLTERDGLGDDRVTSLHADGDVLWVGAYGYGVTRIHAGTSGDTLTRLAARGPSSPQRVNDILRRADGVLWMAADNGLFRLAGDSAVLVNRRDGSGITQAEALRVDAEGNLWIGSRQGGLYRLRDASAQTMTTADGLPHDHVAAVDGDGDGGLWIATSGGVAHSSGAGDLSAFTRASGALPDDIARDVLRDPTGTVWVATNGGLTRFRDGRWRSFTAADGLADDRVRTLATGKGGTLWIGTLNGLSALRGDRFTSYGRADGLTDGYVLSVFEDSRGTLWVGTQGAGLFRRTDRGFVPGPPALTNQPVFRATESADGTLWFGSARGLARVRGDSVRLFTAHDGLPGNTIFQVVDDHTGRLWLTGPWGIGSVATADLVAVADGRRPTVTARQFGRDDGMPAHEASSISRSWLGPDGVLRFATPSGVALLDPRRIRRNTLPPPTHLKQVVVDGVPMGNAPRIDLGTGTRKLEFRFTAPSFVAPALVRFRYRLDPFDHDWVDGGTERVAHYTRLSPGRYTFRVQARNEDGVWSDSAATVSLRLRPYFWQTWWFAVILTAALAALAILAHWLRVTRVARQVREETLRAMSLRDELTGVYNRRGLLELADQQMRVAERERRGFILVFVDMDGMKRINDTFGHRQGDRAIVDAAALMRTTFRASDILGRLGGDEFAIIMPEEPGASPQDARAEVEAACLRLEETVARHNATANRPYRLALSVGMSHYEPGSPVSMEALLDSADREMYAHKRQKSAGGVA